MGVTTGQMDYAKRRALNIFDRWNKVSGYCETFSGYYHEIQGIIEDAVECGVQMACGIERKLGSEEGEEEADPADRILMRDDIGIPMEELICPQCQARHIGPYYVTEQARITACVIPGQCHETQYGVHTLPPLTSSPVFRSWEYIAKTPSETYPPPGATHG